MVHCRVLWRWTQNKSASIALLPFLLFVLFAQLEQASGNTHDTEHHAGLWDILS